MNERKLTKAELNKREDIVKDMKKNKRELVKRYGKDAEAVMYGRATKLAKKQAESMDQDKIREAVKNALKNPKKADLNKDGKLSDYEKKRGAAIEKSMANENQGFGSSDMSALLNSMHRNLGEPKEFPGLSKIMDAAEDATDFYMDDFEEYSTDRDELVMSNARAYARRMFPDFMSQAAKFIEPIDEMDRNDPIAMRLRAAKMKREKEAAKPKRRPLYGKQRQKVEDALLDINQELKGLYADRRQVMIDMEQEAEPEGGPIADEYGNELNKIEDQIQALIAKRDKLEARLDEDLRQDTENIMSVTKDNKKLFALKKRRAQLMRDMEQEAEIEGGPIADRYGAELNKIDQAIAMLQGHGKWGPERDTDISGEEIAKRAAMFGLEEGDEDVVKDTFYMRDELLKRRARIMRDMEQEAEMEGGPIADRYGKELEKIDSMLAHISENTLEEDLDLGHQDNEPHMLKADLYRIGKYAMELYQILDQFEGGSEEVDLPHWWQSKIIKSKDAIVGAKHYLDFELKEPQIDAMVDVAAGEDVIDETTDKWVVYDTKTKKRLPNASKIYKTLKAAQAFADKQENAKVASNTFYFDKIQKKDVIDRPSVKEARYDGSIQMPSQEEVDAFFKKIGQEDHHLANKPVFGDTEPWDGEDYSNWKNITRGHKLNEGSIPLNENAAAVAGMVASTSAMLGARRGMDSGTGKFNLGKWFRSFIDDIQIKRIVKRLIEDPEIIDLVNKYTNVDKDNKVVSYSNLKGIQNILKNKLKPDEMKYLKIGWGPRLRKAMKLTKGRTPLNEGVWSLGTSKEIKNIIGILDIALDIKDPQELMDLMDMHDKSMYNIIGDDVFHDDIDGAKRELAQNNLDGAYNRLIDAKGRAKDLLKMVVDRESSRPYPTDKIFEVAEKLAKQLKSK